MPYDLQFAQAKYSRHTRRHAQRNHSQMDLPNLHNVGFPDNCGCRPKFSTCILFLIRRLV